MCVVLLGKARQDCFSQNNADAEVAERKASNARHIIGECNCRVLDLLSGGFRGCGKESNAGHTIGECNCRVLDALSGEFALGCERCRCMIGECHCRLPHAL